jgi:hypothetical protein
MKRLGLLLSLFLLTVSSLSGCYAATSNGIIADLRKDFKLTVFSDKSSYNQDEPIKIWATLEYIGSNDQIDIWHGDPYVTFALTNNGDINMNPVISDVLGKTTLVKGEIYRFDFVKSGSYEPTATDALFWKEFYGQKELCLPPGTYIIKANGEFSLSKQSSNYNNNLSEELQIKVQ